MAPSLHKHTLTREFLAEFIGTCVLMLFGVGAVAQFKLSGGQMATGVSVPCTWAVGVMMGLYVSCGVSGGHINPAVSVAMACLGRLPWYKVPAYCLAQCMGSFTACVLVYLVYMDALDHFDGGVRQTVGENATAGIWATYPQPYVSTWTALGDQVFATALLLICVMAISDGQNMQPPNGMFPFCIGLIVGALGLSFSLNCGNAMNPARDFIPRLFTMMAGWRLEPMSLRDYNYFWVNIIGPHVGAVIGAYIYQAFVGWHWPPPPPIIIPIGEKDQRPRPDGGADTGGEPFNISDFVKQRDGRTGSDRSKQTLTLAAANNAFEPDGDFTKM